MRNELSDKNLRWNHYIKILNVPCIRRNLAKILGVSYWQKCQIAILLYSSYLENKRDAHSFSVFFFLSNLSFCLNRIHVAFLGLNLCSSFSNLSTRKQYLTPKGHFDAQSIVYSRIVRGRTALLEVWYRQSTLIQVLVAASMARTCDLL